MRFWVVPEGVSGLNTSCVEGFGFRADGGWEFAGLREHDVVVSASLRI